MTNSNDNKNSSRTQDANSQRDGRGFAAMDPSKQREIASMGGQSQGKENNPGNFANDPERASEAGRKGGSASGGAQSSDNQNSGNRSEESE